MTRLCQWVRPPAEDRSGEQCDSGGVYLVSYRSAGMELPHSQRTCLKHCGNMVYSALKDGSGRVTVELVADVRSRSRINSALRDGVLAS